MREKDKELVKLRNDSNLYQNLKTNEEEQEKKIKSMQSQVSSVKKKNTELQSEMKKKEEFIESLQKEI